LIDGLDALVAFARKGRLLFRNRHSAEISLHIVRTAINLLPLEMRRESHRWLTQRGYMTLDNGDLFTDDKAR
jgi:hypothetical protein